MKNARRFSRTNFSTKACLIAHAFVRRIYCQRVMYYFKNECEGFIRFPNARKHLKPRGRRPSGFIVFERSETDETRSTSFLNYFSNKEN